jgi:hypothetical protein
LALYGAAERPDVRKAIYEAAGFSIWSALEESADWGRMSTFEYLSVLLSIIIGLGVTHMIMGLGRLISHTSGRSIYWVHLVWTFNIALSLVVYWWWAINLQTLDEWSFLPFLLVLLEPSLLCLAGAILYPVSMPADLEYKTHFHRSRGVFFSVIVAISGSDLILVLYYITTLGWPYYILLFTTVCGGIIAAIVDNERLQGAFAIFYFCGIFTFVLGTQSSIPA